MPNERAAHRDARRAAGADRGRRNAGRRIQERRADGIPGRRVGEGRRLLGEQPRGRNLVAAARRRGRRADQRRPAAAQERPHGLGARAGRHRQQDPAANLRPRPADRHGRRGGAGDRGARRTPADLDRGRPVPAPRHRFRRQARLRPLPVPRNAGAAGRPPAAGLHRAARARHRHGRLGPAGVRALPPRHPRKPRRQRRGADRLGRPRIGQSPRRGGARWRQGGGHGPRLAALRPPGGAGSGPPLPRSRVPSAVRRQRRGERPFPLAAAAGDGRDRRALPRAQPRARNHRRHAPDRRAGLFAPRLPRGGRQRADAPRLHAARRRARPMAGRGDRDFEPGRVPGRGPPRQPAGDAAPPAQSDAGRCLQARRPGRAHGAGHRHDLRAAGPQRPSPALIRAFQRRRCRAAAAGR